MPSPCPETGDPARTAAGKLGPNEAGISDILGSMALEMETAAPRGGRADT